MKTPHEEEASRFSLRDSARFALGQITAAGVIVDGPGVPEARLREFGSYALVWMLAGRGRYRDANGLCREVEPGELIVVFPDLGQSYGPQPGHTWTELFVIFDGPVFDVCRQQGLLDPHHPICRPSPSEAWLARLEQFTRPAPATPLGRVQEANRLLALISEMMLPPPPQEASADAWLDDACRLLSTELHADIDMPELAARLSMPYETFRKYFRARTGQSPARYRFLRRVEAACELLQYDGLHNRQIAEALGFGDEYSFIKRFKQAKGMTPQAFRRAQHTPSL